MTKTPPIEFRPGTYPNDEPYVDVRVAGEIVGHYVPVDGGYLVWGCRKPCPTERDARKKILTTRLKKVRAEAARLEELIGTI